MNVRAILASVAVLLAPGCTAGEGQDVSAPKADPTDAEFDAQTGAIRGVVTDDTLTPLPEAQVLLRETGAVAVTAGDGTFQFSRVPPGPVRLEAQRIGYVGVARSIEVVANDVVEVALMLAPLSIVEPYFETAIQDGLIGCGILLKTNNDPNASHNLVAACGIFGNAGYHDIDEFHLAWPMGDLEETSGAWGETTWTPTQAAGRGLGVIWTLWDNTNSVGGTYTFTRAASPQSPIAVSFPSSLIIKLLEERSGIQNCAVENCTVHTYHYGRAETSGGASPVDVGLSLQQRYSEFFTLFFNQELPTRFSALPDQ